MPDGVEAHQPRVQAYPPTGLDSQFPARINLSLQCPLWRFPALFQNCAALGIAASGLRYVITPLWCRTRVAHHRSTGRATGDYFTLVKRRPQTPNTISIALAIRHTLEDSPNAAMPTKKLPVAPTPVHTA